MCSLIRSSRYRKYYNDDFEETPQAVSFTDHLRQNYTDDYKKFIIEKFTLGQLELPFCIRPPFPETVYIHDVSISDGRYESVNSMIFYMYIICDVTFICPTLNRHFTVQYIVNGVHNCSGISQYLIDAELKKHKYIRIKNPVNEYLIPQIYKCDYDRIAYEFLSEYYPEGLECPCKINAFKIAERMGFSIKTVNLSADKKIKGKILFRNKTVTVYENGQAVKRTFPENTILIQKDNQAIMRRSILHECFHAYKHRAFYEFQAFYNVINADKKYLPAGSALNTSFCKSLESMEIQANALPPYIMMYIENVSRVIAEYTDINGICADDKNFSDYAGLIGKISDTFGVSVYAARKRLIELGYRKARGVLVYGNNRYVQEHYIPEDFPDDYTYTLPLIEISKFFRENITFLRSILSGNFVYADGHLCVNFPKYTYKMNGQYWLTEYAKKHMSECCISFRRVYGHQKYNYTFGELNSDGTFDIMHFINDEQFKRLEENRKKMLLNDLYVIEGGIRRPMTRAETVKFHMKRLHINEEQLIEMTNMSKDSICALRSEKSYQPRPETVFAFCKGLRLEKIYWEDLIDKTKIRDKIAPDKYAVYCMILETEPTLNVLQINDYLLKIGMKPWTRQRKG